MPSQKAKNKIAHPFGWAILFSAKPKPIFAV
jgi:hypothetical protein